MLRFRHTTFFHELDVTWTSSATTDRHVPGYVSAFVARGLKLKLHAFAVCFVQCFRRYSDNAQLFISTKLIEVFENKD